ncbi:MAG TPA: Stp1/IreP family PP2C-type Ser/Thr phosphatase [Polyangia bacterium]|nr:Stp1/IreP family PP2C-type Ser/Thr phosphatase [Polyangia bacterium]
MNDAGSETSQAPAVRGDTRITVRVFGRTDVGLVREHNEDNFLIADLTAGNRSIRPEVRTHNVGELGTLFVVCDGMGGAAAGEVASRIGVDTVHEMMQQEQAVTDDGQLAIWLEDAIREAGTRIYTAARLNRGQRGMGTTVTAAVLAGPRLVLGQVGDSRAHIIRQGRLVQVTKDQSLVQQLIDAKQLTEEEAKNFDRSNIILQALGTTEDVHVDVTSVLLRRGDALVMCSDGLSGPVEAAEIQRIVAEQDDPLEACRLLTEKACENGGDDNITVIVARFEGEGIEPPSDADELFYEKFSFSRVTETTARTPMPQPPAKEQAKVTDASAAVTGTGAVAAGSAAGATATAAETTTAQPSAATAATDAAPAAATVAPADDEGPGRSKAGPVLGVLAALVLGGVVAAYFSGVFSSGPAGEDRAADPAVVPAVAPAKPIPAPKPPTPIEAAPVLEAPPLAPIAAEDIAGAPEEAVVRERPATAKKPASEEQPGKAAVESKPPVAQAPEPKEKPKKGEAETTDDDPAKPAAKQKSGKSKSGGSADIPDNPF